LSLACLWTGGAIAAADDTKGSAPSVFQAGGGGATYQLLYKFEAGQVWHYEVSDDMTFTTQKGQATLTALQESQSWKHYRVVSVDANGTAVLEPTIDRVRLSVRSGEDQGVFYDSQSGTAPPAVIRGIADTLQRPLAHVTFTSNGEMVTGKSLLPTSDEKDNAAATDDASLNFLIVFPKTPVKVGETWKDQIKVSVTVDKGLRQPVNIQRQYTLQTVEGDLATISLKTSIMTLVDPAQHAQLIQRAPNGTIVFDMQRGLIVSRKLDIDGEVIGFAGGDSKLHAVSHRLEKLVEGAATADARSPEQAPAKAAPQR
jgi:hypothetical protein